MWNWDEILLQYDRQYVFTTYRITYHLLLDLVKDLVKGLVIFYNEINKPAVLQWWLPYPPQPLSFHASNPHSCLVGSVPMDLSMTWWTIYLWRMLIVALMTTDWKESGSDISYGSWPATINIYVKIEDDWSRHRLEAIAAFWSMMLPCSVIVSSICWRNLTVSCACKNISSGGSITAVFKRCAISWIYVFGPMI